MNNPFYNRRAVTDPSVFFGRSDQLDGVGGVFERLNDERPQCISILGDRRFGKTSLLNSIAHPEGRSGRTVRPKTLLVHPRFGVNPPKDPNLFVHRLHVALGREAEIVDGSPVRTDLASSERLLESSASLERMELSLQGSLTLLGRAGWNVFFLLDEFEAIKRNVPPEVLDFFRTLADDAPPVRVGFVVASRLPIDVICPPQSHSKFSNLFGHKIRVANFEPGEVNQLLRRPLEASDVKFSAAEEKEIVRSGGFQPLALQVAAYHALVMKTRAERVQAQTLIPRVCEDMEGNNAQWWQDFTSEEQATLLAVAGCQFSAVNGDVATHLRTKGFLAGLATAPEISPPCLAKWMSRNALGKAAESGFPGLSPKPAPSSATRLIGGAKPFTIEDRFVRRAQVRTLGRLMQELRGQGENASAVLEIRLKTTPILRELPPPRVKGVILAAAADQDRKWRGKALEAVLKLFSLSDHRMLSADRRQVIVHQMELRRILREGIADLLHRSGGIESLDAIRSDSRYAGSLVLRILSDDEWQRRQHDNSDWVEELVEQHINDLLSAPLLFVRRP